MPQETLLPCPFCGEMPKAERFKIANDGYLVACRNKDCTVHPSTCHQTPEAVTKFWNTRATTSLAAQDIDNMNRDWQQIDGGDA